MFSLLENDYLGFPHIFSTTTPLIINKKSIANVLKNEGDIKMKCIPIRKCSSQRNFSAFPKLFTPPPIFL